MLDLLGTQRNIPGRPSSRASGSRRSCCILLAPWSSVRHAKHSSPSSLDFYKTISVPHFSLNSRFFSISRFSKQRYTIPTKIRKKLLFKVQPDLTTRKYLNLTWSRFSRTRRQRRSIQDCFFTPRPPNWGLSIQYTYTIQNNVFQTE